MSQDTLYLLSGPELIGTARWAAERLLLPKIQELSERATADQARERGLAPVWRHTASKGAIVSMCPDCPA